MTLRVEAKGEQSPVSDRKEPKVNLQLEGIGLEHRPKVVCLCGSTRFIPAFNEARVAETLAGNIVLSIELVTTQAREDDPQHVNPERKAMLDELHLRKIDLADEVLVLNVGGYIGESTRREVEYAEIHGKPLRYLEPLDSHLSAASSDEVRK